MKVDYQRSLTHCYMIFSEEGTEIPDNFQLRILASSRIEGILPVTEEHVDNQQSFRYEITSLMPFRDYAETRTFRVEDLRTLFGGLLDTMMQAEDYLLESERILLDPEYLYVSWESGRIWAAYDPYHREEIRAGLSGLTEYLLRIIGYGDQEAVIQTCRFLHALHEPGMELDDLRKLLEQGARHDGAEDAYEGMTEEFFEEKEAEKISAFPEIGEEPERRIHSSGRFLPEKQTLVTAVILVPAAAALYFVLQMQKWLALTRTESALCAAAFAGVVVLCLILTSRVRRRKEQKGEAELTDPASGEEMRNADPTVSSQDLLTDWYGEQEGGGERTMMLGAFQSENTENAGWVLRPSDPGSGLPVIPLTGTEVLIGQRGGPSDVPIDDPTVSRVHARLTRSGDSWSIHDLGSRNGTVADGKKAIGRESVPLADGSRISFARCAYTLRKE